MKKKIINTQEKSVIYINAGYSRLLLFYLNKEKLPQLKPGGASIRAARKCTGYPYLNQP